MTRRRVAWAIAGLAIASILGVSLVSPRLGLVGAATFLFGIASFSLVGALLISRVPGNPIGVMLLSAGTLLASAMVVGAFGDIGAAHSPAWPGSDIAADVQPILFVLPFFIALGGVPLVFPDGHLPSPRFRWVVGAAIADALAWVAASIARALLTGSVAVAVPDRAAVEDLLNLLNAFFIIATIVTFGGGVIAIALRFRRGGPLEREQIKWLLAVAAAGAMILPLSFVVGEASIPALADVLANLTIFTLFALPIVIAVAILRYRLFEIDRIISRTISWALVSALLVGAFGLGVMALQAILADVIQGQTLAVAASTLLAFALFQPARVRIQQVVDRRFDRARYDTQRTADSFAERVRNEVDLRRITGALLGTTGAAVRPADAAVWLRNSLMR